MLHRWCREQVGVIEAVQAGRDADERMRAHLASCASCREAADAVAWMRRLGGTADERRPLPPAATIWWKAQLARRWEAERRASRPIERMQRAEVALGLVSLAALAAWAWPALPSWLPRLAALMWPQRVPERWLPLPDAAGQVVVLVLATLLIGGMLVAFVHRALADE
jgi:hypothetical protein